MKRIVLRKKKISDPAKLISIMSRNLDNEMGIVKFYEDNLHLFKDKKSRDTIKALVLASLKHASLFIEEIHRLQDNIKPSKIKIPSSVARKNAIFTLRGAMREEEGAESIYKYQALRITEAKAKAVLLKIASEEVMHQTAVKKMASEIAKGLPEKSRKKQLKKFK